VSDLSAELGTVRENPIEFVRAVLTQVREDDVPFMAGSIAYQAFASLIPMFVLLFLALTVLGDEQLARRVVALTEGLLPQSGRELLGGAIASEDGIGGTSATIIGVVTLLWGSLKIFRGLDKAFS